LSNGLQDAENAALIDQQSIVMKVAVTIALALFASTVLAQTLPQPKPGSPGGSCPHGYTTSGAFCMPMRGAQDAIPKPPNGSCPWGWLASSSYCLRSGR
jgi:hypothetical protein